jgi:hypothetical protein
MIALRPEFVCGADTLSAQGVASETQMWVVAPPLPRHRFSNPNITSTIVPNPKRQLNEERCMVARTGGFLLVPISGVTTTSQLFQSIRCGAIARQDDVSG